MSFDKTILDDTINQMNQRLRVINTKKNELQELLLALESIQDEEYLGDVNGVTTRLTRTKKDQGTGSDFTNSRLDEIYDSCIPKAQVKLAETI